AEADCQVTLALPDVVRQQIDQQLRDPLDEFAGLGEGADISRDARMASCKFLESRNVVGVRKKANVENQIAIRGEAVPVAEAGDVNEDLRFLALALELLLDETAQVVHVEFRSVNDQIGEGADGREHFALPKDTLADGLFAGAEWMRPARFAEPAHQRLVIGFEEEQPRIQARADTAPGRRKPL